jgi:hypothetical protein
MTPVTPLDEYSEGRLGLPELLTKIERTFVSGDRASQSALIDSWRKSDFRKLLDQHSYKLIDEKIDAEYRKTVVPESDGDRTVIFKKENKFLVGHTIKGRFVLEEMLGSGGMGVVYRATDLRKKEAQDRDPSIAIKVLNEDFRSHPDSLKTLQREAKKAQILAHPNIITVYDFDRDDALIYLTMEFLSGGSLEKKLKAEKNGFPMDEVLSIVKSVGAALSYAHENGIVHSDLKPANIIITDSGRIKVIDFGIARALKKTDHKEETQATAFDVGSLRAMTPAYATIEMIEGGKPDVRDDIFALGCITYELVTGRHPFGRMMATDARDNGIVPKRPATLSQKQWRALTAALNFDRESRTATIGRFVEDFSPSAKHVPRGLIFGGVAAIAGTCVAAAVLLGVVPNPFTHPPIVDDRAPPAARSETSAADAAAAEAAKKDAARQAAEAANREADRVAAEAAKKEADRLAAEVATREAARQAAEAAKKEADRLAAEAAQKAAELQATEAAKREADRLAAEAAQKEAARQAAEAAKREADRLAAEAAQREADRLAAETARKEAERQAAETAKKEAERLAAEAARIDAERQAAEAARREAEEQSAEAVEATRREGARVSAEAARRDAELQAAEAARLESERQAAEATKKETDRLAAEAAKKETDQKAAETARLESERRAAEAARKEAERQAAEAKKEAARQAAEAAKQDAARQAAERAASKNPNTQVAEVKGTAPKGQATQPVAKGTAATETAPPKPADQQVAVLEVPKLTTSALMGNWCAGSLKISLTPTEWIFALPNGSSLKLEITGYRVAEDKILINSRDPQNRDTVTEFGTFQNGQMTQIRGKLATDSEWNYYRRVFTKCG